MANRSHNVMAADAGGGGEYKDERWGDKREEVYNLTTKNQNMVSWWWDEDEDEMKNVMKTK